MIAFQKRPLPFFVLAWALFLLGWSLRLAHAEEQGAQTKPEEAQAKTEEAQTKTEEAQTKKAKTGGAAASKGFDPAVVSAGQAAFERGCTKCHDAARSLERTKDLAGWRATVRRMAQRCRSTRRPSPGSRRRMP